jgi:hypothetical protein
MVVYALSHMQETGCSLLVLSFRSKYIFETI